MKTDQQALAKILAESLANVEMDDELDDEPNEKKKNQPKDGDIKILDIDGEIDPAELVVPFVIFKKLTNYYPYKCPHCGFEDKVTLKVFEDSSFLIFSCPNCTKEILFRLDFEPKVISYKRGDE